MAAEASKSMKGIRLVATPAMFATLDYRSPHANGRESQMAASFDRRRQILPCDTAPETVDWDPLLASIRDAWHCEAGDTEEAYGLLSTLVLFSEWRSPPPLDVIRNSFYCGLMVEILSSTRCHRCQGQALRLICFALDKCPETLPYFRSADLVRGLFTFLEFAGSMQQPMCDVAPFYVISCITQFASTPQGVPLILDDADDHESFFGQVLRLLDSIVCHSAREPLYPPKTEAKIYELFQNIARWPGLDPSVYDVIFGSYSRVFEMARAHSYPDVTRALQFLWCARPECRDHILDPRLSKPVCALVSSIGSLKAIPHAIGLTFGFLLADRTLSVDLDPFALFDIARTFAEQDDTTTDTALQVLGEKFSADGGDWPGFPFGDLIGFCCAQLSDEWLCFHRIVGTAALVLAMLATAGSGVFADELAPIVAAFDVAESGSTEIIATAIAAAERLLGDAARQGADDARVLEAVGRFLETVDGAGSAEQCERALDLLGRMAAGSLPPD
jgi:hypothetical protein